MGVSVKLTGEPDAGDPPVRFDERVVETEQGMRLLSHVRGNPDTDESRSLNHRATTRLYVRRGKVLYVRWVRDPSGPGSFRPEAVGVAGEATNRRKPSMTKGCLRQFSELAGLNVSERRADLENVSCGSRLSARRRKAATSDQAERS